MTTPNASATARGVAVLRAAHRIIDREPLLLDDSVVAKLLGADIEQQVRARVAELESPVARGLRSHVLLRSRFTEDSLALAVDEGIRQYVVLGAGLDTFAYRQPPWASGLTIVEVDHPASQAYKKGALASAGLPVPANVRYADVDLERETLAGGLQRCGVAMVLHPRRNRAGAPRRRVSTVALLGRDEATRRYYADRRDGLVAPRRVSIVAATV